MAQALLIPLLESGLISPPGVQAAVASHASAQRLSEAHGLAVSTDAEAAWASPVVLLAVKPQQLEAVAAAVPPKRGGLLISVLAGVTLQRLQRLLPAWRCVRAVPNTPALVRQGLTGLAFAAEVSAAERDWVRQLFALVGEVAELPETQLDAFLALTSSGPAFIALVAEAMADGAVAAGLPRALAQHLAHRTLAGTAALLHEQELHPGMLKDMVSSPGGTTIAGLRHLERQGLRSALIEAVVAAAERSRQLA
ncbi:MAG: pyrroline-5-carboxylate reductase [Cyanobacteria bacterium M_surface_10_m2_119]|nr:pyrroline-5-carboxylate reductase [Cyanobacteria bacterium M_surface_10_m2_119]